MRKAPALIILLSAVSSCGKNGKDMQHNTPDICFTTSFIDTKQADMFQSVYFLNGKDGFVTGYNGGIYKTTDAAKTFAAMNSNTNLPVRGIWFTGNETGFAVGGDNACGGTGCVPPGGFILKTTDGGQNWSKLYTPSEKIELSSVYFINANTGFCVGDHTIIKTTNGGLTWTEKKINNLGGKMMKVLFTDAQNGFIVCLFDKILRTKNGGDSWEITSPAQEVGYYSIAASNGVDYVCGQGKILKSVNNGSTWTALVNSPTDIYDIKFVDKNTGYAFGRGNYSGGDFGYYYGAMYCTQDGGNTWNGNGDFNKVRVIQAVSFPSDTIGYAVSQNKVLRIEIK